MPGPLGSLCACRSPLWVLPSISSGSRPANRAHWPQLSASNGTPGCDHLRSLPLKLHLAALTACDPIQNPSHFLFRCRCCHAAGQPSNPTGWNSSGAPACLARQFGERRTSYMHAFDVHIAADGTGDAATTFANFNMQHALPSTPRNSSFRIRGKLAERQEFSFPGVAFMLRVVDTAQVERMHQLRSPRALNPETTISLRQGNKVYKICPLSLRRVEHFVFLRFCPV